MLLQPRELLGGHVEKMLMKVVNFLASKLPEDGDETREAARSSLATILAFGTTFACFGRRGCLVVLTLMAADIVVRVGLDFIFPQQAFEDEQSTFSGDAQP